MIEHFVGKTECPRCGNEKADKYVKPDSNSNKETIIYCSKCSFEKHYTDEERKEV